MEVLKQLGKYIDQCCEFRDVRSRSSGRKNFVELKLVLPRALSFHAAHRLALKVEHDLRANISHCEASVSVVPCDEDCLLIASTRKCPYLSEQRGS